MAPYPAIRRLLDILHLCLDLRASRSIPAVLWGSGGGRQPVRARDEVQSHVFGEHDGFQAALLVGHWLPNTGCTIYSPTA